MKILMVVPEYPPDRIGGGGIVYENLAQQYANKGHEVIVIHGNYLTRSWNEKIAKSIQGNIIIYSIPEIPYPQNSPYLRTAMPPTLKTLRQLKVIIQEIKPDIAHLHGYGWPLVTLAANILKSTGLLLLSNTTSFN